MTGGQDTSNWQQNERPLSQKDYGSLGEQESGRVEAPNIELDCVGILYLR